MARRHRRAGPPLLGRAHPLSADDLERPRAHLHHLAPPQRAADRDLLGIERYDYFAYITNYRVPLADQYFFCVERRSLERCVKESKLGFVLDHLPCGEFEANQAYLHHVQLAYNIAIAWKLIHLPRTGGANRWTVATIRRWLWRVPGTFRRRGERWSLSLAAYWPSDKADLLRHAIERVVRPPPGTR